MKISGQFHDLADHDIRPKSIAFAQFFTDTLGRELVHTICISLEGEIYEISVWQDNQLVHQVSVPYGGRHLFHRILRNNLAFIGEIFGLSSQDAKSLQSNFSSRHNFNAVLDRYLRGNAKKILKNGYIINADKTRSREFRTLVAFALGGLYHYQELRIVKNEMMC